MDRKIKWYSGCHDEIELVYEKADENKNISIMLMELETMAIQEAVNCLKWAINLSLVKSSLK